MNENQPRPAPPDGGRGPLVPQRVTGPVLVGVMPGQPLAVVQRAAELAYTLDAKLICAYVDITTYLIEEPEEQIEAPAPGPEGDVDDAEGVSAGMRLVLQDILDGAGVRWSFLILSGDPARSQGQLA